MITRWSRWERTLQAKGCEIAPHFPGRLDVFKDTGNLQDGILQWLGNSTNKGTWNEKRIGDVVSEGRDQN